MMMMIPLIMMIHVMITKLFFSSSDVLTASPHASINGLIPLVAWRLSSSSTPSSSCDAHMTELVNAQRFGGLEEKKPRARRGEETKKETDGASSSSMMLEEEEVMLGPETAFLAEGSVHDTGGMVEWAGTVGRDVGCALAIFSSSFFSLLISFAVAF